MILLDGNEWRERKTLERDNTNIVKIASKEIEKYFFSVGLKFECFKQVILSAHMINTPKMERIISLWKVHRVEETSRRNDNGTIIVTLERA